MEAICDGCYTVSFAFFECYHEPNYVTCDTNRCLVNVLETATCWWKGADWPCNKVHCNTKEDFWGDPEVVQYTIEDPNVTCPGGIVEFEPLYMLYQGCDLCLPKLGFVSCMTNPNNCHGAPEDPNPRGTRHVCGCNNCD